MTPGERVAQVAADVLGDGPMGNTVRGADYQAFLDRTWGSGSRLRHIRTSCAIFAGACLLDAGVLPRIGWPKARAITTWLGLGGFGGRCWVPVDRLVPRPGDIFYVCGNASPTWHAAANGHVGILIEGDGWGWVTAEGGGGDGTLCRLSTARKDLRRMSRTLRGVWRPALALPPEPEADTDPAPPPSGHTLRYGSRGADVADVQRIVGTAPDGIWGPKTSAAVLRYRASHDLSAEPVWDDAARSTRIP